jgi:hypothetical protein
MMSSEDMDKLEKASGAEFDKMFLEMMVEHHEGAIEMAQTEKADGEYGPAAELANDVITGPLSSWHHEAPSRPFAVGEAPVPPVRLVPLGGGLTRRWLVHAVFPSLATQGAPGAG